MPSLKCPICRADVQLRDPFMPFCSERCKLLDLGNWASERYVISSPMKPEDLLEVAQDSAEKI